MIALLLVVVAVGVGLRLWRVDNRVFTPDESYTAIAVDRPLVDIPRFIADTDPHPPFFYVVAAPFQRLSRSEWALRLPSALCAIAALGLFAWWHRNRGWEGLLAVGLFAVAPFQLIFEARARMYGLLILAGVAAAWAADRWLDTRSRRWIVVAGVAALVAAFSQVTGILLAGALLLVPGLRRDRSAWEWRGTALAVIGVFGLLWGGTAIDVSGDSLYARPGLKEVTITINEVLAPVPSNRWLVLPLIVIGAVALVLLWPRLGRVWLALVVAPAVAALVVSWHSSIFIPKTLAVASWGIPVALAAVAGAAARVRPLFGALVCALLVLLTVPYVSESLRDSEHTEGIVAATRAAVQPGDAVAAHPPRTLIPWYLDEYARSSTPLDTSWPDTVVWVPGDEAFSGRVWIVDTLYAAPALEVDAPSCGPDQVIDSVYRLRCVTLPVQLDN